VRQPAAQGFSSDSTLGAGIDLDALLGGLTVRPGANGGITVEAPQQAAATLAVLLQRLAEQLRAAAGPVL
jgi:hypothetical protein